MEHHGRAARQPVPNIRSTPSFIIFLDTPLGQGATSKVYGGRHKKSGKRVACKVPHTPNLFRMGTDMERESQLLLGLRNKNIVCLEAIEKDQISKENILMMELCTGGSLYDVLEKPENANGLAEKVFFQVLADITAGIKYLRDNGVAHRDVKPGNIMCFKDEHGQTIYKLADFGAARQLTDDENFTSLHGTEEYLHPNVFERAVLKKPAALPFDARIDLWSIGATLYHLATGQLPFRPQGGRKNSRMMFYLTTKKAEGVISGVQTGPGDHEITWSRELPETCRLSGGLRKLLTPLLAGLLECNPTKVFSFQRFFEESQRITNKTVIDIFWVCEASFLKIYCSPTDMFAEFQEHIASQTKLPATKQSILYNGDAFKPDGTSPVHRYPITSEANPIVLSNKEQIHIPHQITPPFVATMPVLRPRFSTQLDYPIAKGALATGHILQLRQKLIHNMHQLFDLYFVTIRTRLKKDILSLQVHHKGIKGKLSVMSRELQDGRRIVRLMGNAQESHTGDITHRLERKLEECIHEHMQYELQSKEIGEILDYLHVEVHFSDELDVTWDPAQGCNLQHEKCIDELLHLTNETEDIYKRFTRDKKTGKISYNEEQIHKMEKLNLGELMKKIMACNGQCEERWRAQHRKLMVCHNKAYSQRQKLMEADKCLAPLVQQCNVLELTVSDLHAQCWQIVEAKPTIRDVKGHRVYEAPKEILLSASTQTSLPKEETPSQRTSLLIDHHYDQLTKGGKPLVMGRSSNVIQKTPYTAAIDRSSYQHPEPYQTASALSAPTCGTSHFRFDAPSGLARSSPPVLVARGISRSAPDPPTELYAGDPSRGAIGGIQDLRYPAGDYRKAGEPRMIEVSKELKKRVRDYTKESNDTDRLQRDLARFTQLELDDLSLGAPPEMPPQFTEDSSLLYTLTGGMDEGDESILADLDIKRPPASYLSGTE
nr:serine/threonine-protein kinase TBK1-like [Lytechinus pictus]